MAQLPFEHIDTIELSGVLPRVFAGDAARPSDVWRGSLRLERGSVYMIEAESGTGKSSLCSFLYGSRTDYNGRITFNGVDTAAFTPEQWCAVRCRCLSLLPQEMGLFGELSVMENIELKNRIGRCLEPDDIRAMLARLEVDHKAAWPVARLSVGQRQRVALVRALCQPFDFLLLDEPVSHLDARNNAAAAQLVAETAARFEAGVIITSVGNPLAVDNHIKLKL